MLLYKCSKIFLFNYWDRGLQAYGMHWPGTQEIRWKVTCDRAGHNVIAHGRNSKTVKFASLPKVRLFFQVFPSCSVGRHSEKENGENVACSRHFSLPRLGACAQIFRERLKRSTSQNCHNCSGNNLFSTSVLNLTEYRVSKHVNTLNS